MLPVAAMFAIPPAMASPDLDITHYRLQLAIGFENKGLYKFRNELEGQSRISLVNRSDQVVDRIPFLLNRMMKVVAVRDGAGRELAFSQRLTALDDWDQFQANLIEVNFAGPVASGAATMVEIDYRGPLNGYTETGMLYVRETLDPDFTIIRSEALAYPQPSGPAWSELRERWRNDTFDQEIIVTLPEGHVAASGGELVSTTHSGGTVRFEYRSRRPGNVIMVPIARYRTLDAGPGRIYYLPQSEDSVQAFATAMERALDLFAGWFGPTHREAGYAVAEIPEGYGSQALPSIVIQTAAAFREPENLVELYHELSHFWNVPERGQTPSRWNEGLATFLQALARDRLDAPGSLDETLARRLEQLRKRLADNPDHARIRFLDYGKEGVTSALSYTGGAVFFGILYELIGEDAFLELMGGFYQAHHADGATDEAFVDHAVEHGGPRVARLFDDWFRTPRYAEHVTAAKSMADLVALYGSQESVP